MECLFLLRLQRGEIDEVDEASRLSHQYGLPARPGRRRGLDHQKYERVCRVVPDSHRCALRNAEELSRPHPDILLPDGEHPFAADHLKGDPGIGCVNGDLLPRLQADLADLQIILLHKRRNAAPLVAEHLTALQIDDVHFFTSQKGN